MNSAVLEEVRPSEVEDEEEYDEYYDEDQRLYADPEFQAAMEEAMREYEDIIAHPERHKFYTSTKEMFRDMGFDVSNFPDR